MNRTMRHRGAAVAALLMAAMAARADGPVGGTISGTISGAERGAVVVVQGHSGFVADSSESFELIQKAMLFEPPLMVVPRGARVAFPNSEPIIYHSVFSPSDGNEFDLGTYPAGESRGSVFEGAGVCEVLCKIHSRMYAIVVVTESPYHALTDATGTFEIENVPAGDWTVTCTTALDQDYENSETLVTVRPGERTVAQFGGRWQ